PTAAWPRRAPAPGGEREPGGAGAPDDRAPLPVRYPELVGGHVRERGAQPADVGRAGHQRHGAVLVDGQGRTGLAADVEPEARGHAAALPLPERRVPVLGLLDRVERLFQTERAELRAVRGLGALARRVHHAELNPIDSELLGDLVDHALDRELGDRRAGRAVGRHLRAVGDDVVADDLDVLHVVRRVSTEDTRLHRRALERARLVLELGEAGDELAVLRGAHLDLDGGARGRARGLEDLLARHDHLHRTLGLPRERQGQRLQIDDGLAAEAAADLRGGHADLGDVHPEETRVVGAHDEVALRAARELGRAVLGHAGQRGVRLDVALVHRRRLELALDDDVRLLEAGLDVA